MHSRIFQMSKTPIEEENYMIEENFYDHWFTREIADYVSNDTYRDDDISWLVRDVKGIELKTDEHGDYIVITDKETYFKDDYIRFTKAISKLKQCTLSDFSNEIAEMYDIKTAYADRFGFYILDEDYYGDLCTLSSFMRRAKNGDVWYIGCTLDYHY